MQAYDEPPTTEETESFTVEQAVAAVHRLNAGFQVDHEHPAFCRQHAQYADYARYSLQLHTIVAQARADEKDAADQRQIDAMLEANPELGTLLDAPQEEDDE